MAEEEGRRRRREGGRKRRKRMQFLATRRNNEKEEREKSLAVSFFVWFCVVFGFEVFFGACKAQSNPIQSNPHLAVDSLTLVFD